MASARPLPVNGWIWSSISVPITGIRATAESITSSRSDGLSSSTNPSTETNASSSGNSEKKA